MEIYKSSRMLFFRDFGNGVSYMGCNTWGNLGSRIYDNPSEVKKNLYFAGKPKNKYFSETVDVFEKACSNKLLELLKSKPLDFNKVKEVIVNKPVKNKRGQFCIQGEE